MRSESAPRNTTPDGGSAIWQDLAAGAPRIAEPGLARFRATRVALLGTLRLDGSPRISPVEPYLADGELLIGGMAWSRKVADLRRDPRYVLHSAVTGPDSGESELKLHGVAVDVGERYRDSPAEAWWVSGPRGEAAVFALRIEQAVLVEWDLAAAVMTVRRWSPRRGYRASSRSYP